MANKELQARIKNVFDTAIQREESKPLTLPQSQLTSASMRSSFTPSTQQRQTQTVPSGKWYRGESPTYGETMSRIVQVCGDDKKKGQTMMNSLYKMKSDPSSPFYNQYSNPTNQAVKNLQDLGFDTSILSSDFIAQNRAWIESNLDYRSAVGNTPGTPNEKKATRAQKIAYQLYQWDLAESRTQQAEKEIQEAIKEAKYLANDKGRNYSNQQIIDKVNENFEKKYPTLAEMRKSQTDSHKFAPLEFNRGIDYSDDVLEAAIWAARNPDFNGSTEAAMINSYLGRGNQWKEDKDISARLNASDKSTWRPYSLGGTMEDELRYFGIYEADDKWLEDNYSKIMASGDETAMKYYANLVEGNEKTKKLRKEAEDLHTLIDEELDKFGTDADTLIENILANYYKEDGYDFSDLFSLDKSVKKGPKGLVKTTGTVDYSWADVEKEIRDRYEKISTQPQLPAFTESIVNPEPEPVIETPTINVSEIQTPAPQYANTPAPTATQMPGATATPAPSGAVNTTAPTPSADAAPTTPTPATPTGSLPTATATPVPTNGEKLPSATPGDVITNATVAPMGQTAKASATATQIPTKTKMPRIFTDADLAIEKETAKKYSSIAPVIAEKGTEEEKTAVITEKTSFFDKSVELFRQRVGDFAKQIQSSSEKRIITEYGGNYALTKEFGKHLDTIAEKQEKLDEVNAERDKLVEKQKSSEEVQNMYADQYRNVASIANTPVGNNSILDGALDTLRTGDTQSVSYWDAADFLYLCVTGHEPEEDGDENYIQKVQEWSNYINNVRNGNYSPVGLMTEEEYDRLYELDRLAGSLEKEIAAEEEYVAANQKANSKANRDLTFARLAYDEAVRLSGGKMDAGLFTKVETVYNAAEAPADPIPVNLYDAAVEAGKATKEEAIASAKEQAFLLQTGANELSAMAAYLQRNGVQFTGDQKKNIDSYVKLFQSQAADATYVALEGNDDYDAVVAETKEKISPSEVTSMVDAARRGTSEVMSKAGSLSGIGVLGAVRNFNQIVGGAVSVSEITPDEWNRFYYLMKPDGSGKAAAQKYLNHILDPDTGVVTIRSSADKAKFFEELGEKNPLTGFAVARVANILATPAALGYRLSQKIQGKTISQYNKAYDALNAKNFADQGARQAIVDALGGSESALGKIAGMGYSVGAGLTDYAITRYFVSTGLEEASSILGAGKAGQYVNGLYSKARNAGYEMLGKMTSEGSFVPGKAFTAAQELGLQGEEFSRAVYDAVNAAAKASEAGKTLNFLSTVGNGLKEVAYALPMAQSACENEFWRVLNETNDEDKAWLMSTEKFVTSLISYVVIGRGIMRSYNADPESVISGFQNFFQQLGQTELAIGTTSLATNTIDQLTEKAVMGAAGKWQKNYDKYYEEFKSDQIATEKADEDMTNDIITDTIGDMMNAAIRHVFTSGAGLVSRLFNGEKAEQQTTTIRKYQTEEAAQERFPEDNGGPAPTAPKAITGSFAKLPSDTWGTPSSFAYPTQEQAKDAQAVSAMYGASPTNATVALASVLNLGGDADKAAAQIIVGNLAKGDTAVASLAMTQILQRTNYPDITKEAVAQAALTKGKGNEALLRAIEIVRKGQTLTYDDVMDIENGVSSDRVGDPEGFKLIIAETIQKQITANKAVQKAAQSEEIGPARDAVRMATGALADAEQKRDDAVADFEVARENAEDAADAMLADPENKNNIGQVQQTWAHAEGMSKDAEKAENGVKDAQGNLEEAKKDLAEASDSVMTDARVEAQAEMDEADKAVAEMLESQEQSDIQTAISTYHPVKALDEPIQMKLKPDSGNPQGGQVTVVGVFASTPNGPMLVTTNGYVRFDSLRDEDGSAQLYLNEYNVSEAQNPVAPVAWMKHSLDAETEDGETITLVGFKGQDDGNPWVIDSKGRVYDSVELKLHVDQFTGVDGNNALMDLYYEAGGDDLPSVTAENEYREEHPELNLPDGFTKYPGDPVTVTAVTGERFEVIGIDVEEDAPLGFVTTDGTVIEADAITEAPQEFTDWWQATIGEEDYPEPVDYYPEPPEEDYEPEMDDFEPMEGDLPSSGDASIAADLESHFASIPETQAPEYSYKVKDVPSLGGKAAIAPVLGDADGTVIDGIAFDSNGDLVYTKHHYPNSYIEAISADVASTKFIEWALKALDDPEVIAALGVDDPLLVQQAKDHLNDQLHYATDDGVMTNDQYNAQEVAEQPADELHATTEGKTFTNTDGEQEALYDWQDPKYHGPVKQAIKKENPNTKKFKKYQGLDEMQFVDQYGNAIDPEVGKKYFFDNGESTLYYRGYGAYGSYLYPTFESKPQTDDNGNTFYINFMHSKPSVAQSYSGGAPIVTLRYIDNWETAKAAMEDLNLDLVPSYDPDGSGKPGYLVIKPGHGTAITKSGAFFKENELSKFRKTYGGNPKNKGIHAGYPTGRKILIINGLHTNFSTIEANVTLPNGMNLDGIYRAREWADFAFRHSDIDTIIFDEVQDQASGASIGEFGVEICTRYGNQFKSIWNKGSYSRNSNEILAMMKNPSQYLAMKKGDARTFAPTKKPLSKEFEDFRDDLREGTPMEEMTPEEKKAFYERIINTPEIQYAEENANKKQTLPYSVTTAIRKYISGEDRDEKHLEEAGVSYEVIGLLRGNHPYEDAVDAMFSKEDLKEVNRLVKYLAEEQGSAVIDLPNKTVYTGPVDRNRIAHVIIGLPGGGKSSLAEPLSQKTHSIILDPDIPKMLHKKNKNGGNEGPLHNESRYIMQKAQSIATKKGKNIVMPIVGSNYDSTLRQVNSLKKAGYKVYLHRVDIPWNESVTRVLNRLAKDNRYLSIPYIMGEDDAGLSPANIKETYKKLVEGGYVDGYATWDNDVEYGRPPVATATSDEELVTIYGGAFGEPEGTGQGDSGRGLHDSGKIGKYQKLITESSVKPKTAKEKKIAQSKSKIKSPQEILDTFAMELRESFKYGNYRGTNRLGSMSEAEGYVAPYQNELVVKNKNLGDPGIGSHEAGHQLFDIIGMHATDEMIEYMREHNDMGMALDKYTPEQFQAEAEAEFFRRYLESEAEARAMAGDKFYDEFEKMIVSNKRLYKSVMKARDAMRQWYEASDSDKMGATIKYDKYPYKKTVDQDIKDLIARMIDRSAPAEDVNNMIRSVTGENTVPFEQDTRAHANLSNHSQKIATYCLTLNMRNPEGDIIGDGFVKAVFSDTGFKYTRENLHELNKFMTAMHSLQRDEQGKPVFTKEITESGVENYINDILTNRKDIVAAANAAWNWWKQFRNAWLVDRGGRLPKEVADMWDDMYPFYVPTVRINSPLDQRYGLSKGRREIKFREATGGTQDVFSPIHSLIGMVQQIVDTVLTDEAGRAFDNAFMNNPGLGYFAHQIPDEGGSPNTNPSNKLNGKQEQLLDILKGKVDDDILSQVLDITKSKPSLQQLKNDPGILTVHRNDGTTVKYQFDNPYLYAMLSGVRNDQNRLPILDAIGSFTRFMSKLTTGSNPFFAARNAVRDYQTAVNYNNAAASYITAFPKWFKAVVEIARGESEAAQQYLSRGGGGWARGNINNSKSMKQLDREIFGIDTSTFGGKATWLWDKFTRLLTAEDLNGWIEQGSRFMIFKSLDRSTQENIDRAFLASQEGTVDFSRKGMGVEAYYMSRLIPFFAASANGAYRTARQFTQAERGNTETRDDGSVDYGATAKNVMHSKAMKRVIKTVFNMGLVSASAIGSIILFGDDELKKEYAMLSDDIKKNNIILPNPLRHVDKGQPHFIRIPIEQDPLAYAVNWVVTNAIWSRENDGIAIGFGAMADAIFDNINPVNGSVVQPFVDTSHHRTYYGANTIRSSQSGWDDASIQYNEDTPEIFKTISRAYNTIFGWAGANASPEDIEYLAQQYLGFIGQTVIPALSYDKQGNVAGPRAALNTLANQWTTDATRSSTIINDFYAMKKSFDTIIDAANKDRPENKFRRFLTQEEAEKAYAEAKDLYNGIISDATDEINKMYKDIDNIYATELNPSMQAQLVRERKLDTMKYIEVVNGQLLDYYDKYLKDTSIMEWMSRVATPGKTIHIPEGKEKMPDVFQNDSTETYMERVMSVYDGPSGKNDLNQDLGGGKDAALPHPQRTFEATLSNGKKDKFEITDDDEWNASIEEYRKAYSQYVTRSASGRKWERLTDAEKYRVLQNAHQKGMSAIKTLYERNHQGVRFKK